MKRGLHEMKKEVKKLKIEQRLTGSFFKTSTIVAGVALLAVLALLVISNRYSYALHNFGFAQGDIGKAMFEFAECRSSLRAAIGYDDAAAIEKVSAQHEEGKALFEEYFKAVENTVVSTDGRQTYDLIKEELDAYWKLDARVMELGANTDRELCRQAQEIAMNELSDSYHIIYDNLEKLLNVKVEQGDALSGKLMAVNIVIMLMILGGIAAAMLTSQKLGRETARGISGPLGNLGERLKTFASGDLSSPFPTGETGDEVELMENTAKEMAETLDSIIEDIGKILGEMAGGNYTVRSDIADRYTGDFRQLFDSMRGLKEQMTETLSSIGEASNHVSLGSNDLAKASQDLAEGSTGQASAVQELHATISDIAMTMKKSAESAHESYERAESEAEKANITQAEMNTMVAAMERINNASKKIESIISEIEDIASQTNLLSLNASIEAARAGEAGRGFAVVADEIRELADHSAQAAKDTRRLIESSIREIEDGDQAAERASNAIGSVVKGIQKIADSSKNLMEMVEGSAEAMRQAESGVNQISEVVQSNAAVAEEASATSQELSAQAAILDGLVGQFTLTN